MQEKATNIKAGIYNCFQLVRRGNDNRLYKWMSIKRHSRRDPLFCCMHGCQRHIHPDNKLSVACAWQWETKLVSDSIFDKYEIKPEYYILTCCRTVPHITGSIVPSINRGTEMKTAAWISLWNKIWQFSDVMVYIIIILLSLHSIA